ncbi:cell division protein ZapE [Ketobacter alkanivorans]|uniref:Cell division protein ZapE n=1 Tax=Ketobacter alkanivorans TaxID=1917421 RepID=A0A2K9LTD3_9GAMM|nr:cell division protein ZapE [Ketobacter alkanivorans]AUM14074.1 cell division protein ZapE [Ketobacter alkanivorans]MCP5017767.1 cell division protein ZapE [Ketobacter sp.]
MTPLEKYQQDLQRADFSYDQAQEYAVQQLDRLYHDLVDRYENRPRSLWARIAPSARTRQNEPCKGLYFWGGVGRGKTYLVDTFFECVPFRAKMRIHFHRFMQRVHNDLKALQGEKNPLDIVAEQLSKEARVLCFDEFFVTDITDAMILGGLMEKLFASGVTLVATSNIVPDQLYRDGLQRARFLPAIELINKYTDIVNVDSGVDYRLRTLEQAEIYHSPLDESAESSLRSSFESLAPEPGHEREAIEINGRAIKTRSVADDVLWCDFMALCDGPRSQNDYIELARIYHAVLISNVPVMGKAQDDMARRFVNMVDEFYDRNVKLIMSGAAPIDGLYSGGRLEFEFQRTRSRLLEMQSREYLARPHKP